MAKMSFLKKGAASHKAFDKAEAEAEAKKAANSGPRRYWMPPDKENQITFLDGSLDADGMLDVVSYWEHNLKLNGSWKNWYPCTQVEEACPICEGGDDPSLVAVFTIIDHSQWESKGVVHKDELRLFVCKRETLRRLQKIAAKRGGLVGCTFDVSRSGDKAAAVGDQFDFVEKLSTADLEKKYKYKKGELVPFDYDEVIKFYPAKELRKMGFGTIEGASIGSADSKAVSNDEDDDTPAPKKPAGKKPVQDYSADM